MSNQYFQWPTKDEHVKAWNQADEITDRDQLPEWYDWDSDDWGNMRYLCNASWQYVKQADQEQWSQELESHPDFIIAHGDDGDGCVTHFYIMIPDNVPNDHWSFKDEIETLDALLDSEEYQSSRFGSSSDDWINDPERMERCHEAAKHGCDGSTHGEHIEDWRECLAYQFDGRLTEQTRLAIGKEIDDCEQWHIDNGSIDTQID